MNVESFVDIVADDVPTPPPVLVTLPVANAVAPELLALIEALSFVLLASALMLKLLVSVLFEGLVILSLLVLFDDKGCIVSEDIVCLSWYENVINNIVNIEILKYLDIIKDYLSDHK
jgi:hypothetical protein